MKRPWLMAFHITMAGVYGVIIVARQGGWTVLADAVWAAALAFCVAGLLICGRLRAIARSKPDAPIGPAPEPIPAGDGIRQAGDPLVWDTPDADSCILLEDDLVSGDEIDRRVRSTRLIGPVAAPQCELTGEWVTVESDRRPDASTALGIGDVADPFGGFQNIIVATSARVQVQESRCAGIS
jgi:hypothetical protein